MKRIKTEDGYPLSKEAIYRRENIGITKITYNGDLIVSFFYIKTAQVNSDTRH